MRKMLVRQIAAKGITDQKVLMAIEKVPRHLFFDDAFLSHAYEDKAFPIGYGQTISQPYTVAFQTQLLEVQDGDKVLEIGTGSGYQACVLIEQNARVYTIEYQKDLYNHVRKFLPSIGYHPMFFHGDGSLGLDKFTPFDKIIVTAAAPNVPPPLIRQLKPGGKLVIPVGDRDKQRMLAITKRSETDLVKKEYDYFSFVPLRGEKGW